MSHIAWSVCLCVYALNTRVSCVKMAESIEMPFGELTHEGPRNDDLDGSISPTERGTFEVLRWHVPRLYNANVSAQLTRRTSAFAAARGWQDLLLDTCLICSWLTLVRPELCDRGSLSHGKLDSSSKPRFSLILSSISTLPPALQLLKPVRCPRHVDALSVYCRLHVWTSGHGSSALLVCNALQSTMNGDGTEERGSCTYNDERERWLVSQTVTYGTLTSTISTSSQHHQQRRHQPAFDRWSSADESDVVVVTFWKRRIDPIDYSDWNERKKTARWEQADISADWPRSPVTSCDVVGQRSATFWRRILQVF